VDASDLLSKVWLTFQKTCEIFGWPRWCSNNAQINIERSYKGQPPRKKAPKPRMQPRMPSSAEVKTQLTLWIDAGVFAGSLPSLKPLHEKEYEQV
jgi:hypothetical protein